MTKEVMKQALEASKDLCVNYAITEVQRILEEALKQEQNWPIQVSIKEFVKAVEGKEDLIGRPVYWAQWPNENTTLQPKQEQDEPVGKFAKFNDGIWREVTVGSSGVLLYTHSKEWVGLTNEQIVDLVIKNAGFPTKLAKAIEAKLKERNT